MIEYKKYLENKQSNLMKIRKNNNNFKKKITPDTNYMKLGNYINNYLNNQNKTKINTNLNLKNNSSNVRINNNEISK